jgi:hypothetical protein
VNASFLISGASAGGSAGYAAIRSGDDEFDRAAFVDNRSGTNGPAQARRSGRTRSIPTPTDEEERWKIEHRTRHRSTALRRTGSQLRFVRATT